MIDCIGCSKYEAKIEQEWRPGQPVAGIFSYGTLNTAFDRMLTVAHWLEVHYPNLRLWREVDHEILTEFLADKQETCATSTMRTYLAELKKLVLLRLVGEKPSVDPVRPRLVSGNAQKHDTQKRVG